MNRKIFLLLACFVFLRVQAQIIINEYSVSNATIAAGGTQFTDNTGGHPDWIELYNSGASVVTIGGWNLSDDPTNLSKYTFPATASVPAGGFLRIWASGKGSSADAAGHIHTTFKLTQCKGDWIVLSNAGTIVDSLQLRKTQTGHSRGRTPNGTTAWKVYTTPTPNASNSGTSYIDYAPTPFMNPTAGFYSGAQNVSIAVVPSASITIYYTTTGAEPTTSSSVYSSAVSISTTTVLRALAVSSNPAYLPSFMETETYFINENINSKYGVVSICGGTALNSLMNGTQNNPKTHLEYFENNLFETESYGLCDKHGNDSWAFDQRGIDFETKDDYGYNNALKHKFFQDTRLGKSNRKEFQHVILKAGASDNFPGDNTVECHMRDAFVQSYAFRKDLELDGRRYKPVIMYVNGKYWGVYELREAFEEDYTDYYYNQPDIMELKYWGGYVNNPPASWQNDWANLYNYVMSNPMTNATNYAHVDSALSFKSLIDYMVYNSYVVNSDFINWNSSWWRGVNVNEDKHKWRYWMWDMDNVYDLGENYSGLPTTDMTSDPCAYTNVFQNAGPQEGHPDMLEKLLTNPDFKSMYINRYADLINSAFKCDSIIEHFNYFRSFLTPEMPRHISKWGGSMSQWNKNMDTLLSKIQRRCSYIESKIESCYNVTAQPLTVDVVPAGAGNVKLNTIWLDNFLWSGTYFSGVNMTFVATPFDPTLYEFDYWEFPNHTPSPNINSDTVTIAYTTSDNVIAHFKEKIKPDVVPTTSTDIIYPTAFSPNGDGKNDVLFALGGSGAKDISIQVWNRWGQLVFSTSDLTKGWDGNFQGTPAQVGVYAYVIKYTNNKDESKLVKGNLTLIR